MRGVSRGGGTLILTYARAVLRKLRLNSRDFLEVTYFSLRPIRTAVDVALSELDADFNAIYSETMAVTPSRRKSSCVPDC